MCLQSFSTGPKAVPDRGSSPRCHPMRSDSHEDIAQPRHRNPGNRGLDVVRRMARRARPEAWSVHRSETILCNAYFAIGSRMLSSDQYVDVESDAYK